MRTRKNPITRAYTLYGAGGVIHRGKPADALALCADAYADWEAAADDARASGLEPGMKGWPARPRFILVSEMSDGSWLEVNTFDGKLMYRKETPRSRLGLQQRIQALIAGVKSFGSGRQAIVGFRAPSQAVPRVSTAVPEAIRGRRTEVSPQVALGAAAMKTERLAYADGVAAQAHVPVQYVREARLFFVPGAEDHPGFPSREVAELWRKKILHEGPVRRGRSGGWIIVFNNATVQIPATKKTPARPVMFSSYEEAWDAFKELAKDERKAEKAKGEAAHALAQSLAARIGPRTGMRAIDARAATALSAAGEVHLPRAFARAVDYRGLRMIVSADGWVEVPGLKKKAAVGERRTVVVPSIEEAKALIDTARDNQAKRLGKTIANPQKLLRDPMLEDWAPPRRIPGGTRVESVAIRLAELANAHKRRFETPFNTWKRVYADPGDTAEDVLGRLGHSAKRNPGRLTTESLRPGVRLFRPLTGDTCVLVQKLPVKQSAGGARWLAHFDDPEGPPVSSIVDQRDLLHGYRLRPATQLRVRRAR